jgi:hypothetical protein
VIQLGFIVFEHVNIIVAEVIATQGKMRFLLKTLYKPYKGIYSLQKYIFPVLQSLQDGDTYAVLLYKPFLFMLPDNFVR